MNKKMKISLILILISIVSFSGEVFSDEEEFHRTVKVPADTEVNVSNVNGKIQVFGWDEDYVDIFALKTSRLGQDELDRVTIDVSVTDVIDIKTLIQKRDEYEGSFFSRLFGGAFGRSPKVNVEYTIKLPMSVILATASNTNGNVNVEGTYGDSILKTTNGNVNVKATDGLIDARTTNGSIYITDGAVARGARTTNGSVKAAISSDFMNETNISTTNGSVTLYVPKGINADLELKTVNGSINLNDIRMLVDNFSKRHVTGSLGDGGKMISARTTNGNITIEEE